MRSVSAAVFFMAGFCISDSLLLDRDLIQTECYNFLLQTGGEMSIFPSLFLSETK